MIKYSTNAIFVPQIEILKIVGDNKKKVSVVLKEEV